MDDSPEATLRAARAHIIDSVQEIRDISSRAARKDEQAVRAAREKVHRLAGVAGVVGLPLVSERAFDLEEVLAAGDPSPDRINTAVERLRTALAADLATPGPPWLE